MLLGITSSSRSIIARLDMKVQQLVLFSDVISTVHVCHFLAEITRINQSLYPALFVTTLTWWGHTDRQMAPLLFDL